MPYTTEEGGRLNNFAVEPRVYKAEPPNKAQKRNYAILGGAAVLLLSGLFYVVATVS